MISTPARLKTCRFEGGSFSGRARLAGVRSGGDSWGTIEGHPGVKTGAHVSPSVCDAMDSQAKPHATGSQIFQPVETFKVCSKCSLAKPRTVKFFPSDGRKSDGLRAECRACFSAPRRERYWQRREEMLVKNAAYRAATPDCHKKRKKAGYVVEDAETAKAKHRAGKRRHLGKKITDRLRERVRRILRGTGISLGRNLVSCTPDQLRDHIAAQFQPGMSWDNYGDWHVDHIRPLASFDLADPEQRQQANHFTNLQPLWAADNLRKGAKFQ